WPGVGAVVSAGEGPESVVRSAGAGALQGGAVVELDSADADVVGGGGGDGHGLGGGVGGAGRAGDGHGRGRGVDVDSEDDGRRGGAVVGSVVGLGGPGVGAVVRAREGPQPAVRSARGSALEDGAVIELDARDADVVGG